MINNNIKVIIAGCRTFNDYPRLKSFMDKIHEIVVVEEVVCGGAPGADTLGKQWGEENKIPVKMFPARWALQGPAAGPIRNKKMAEYGEVLIAFWDGSSPGTRNMIKQATEHNLEVHIIRTDR